MRINLSDNSVLLLKELLTNLKEIAEKTEDDVQLSYYIKIENKLRRRGYTDFKGHEVEFLWYTADTGMIMADQAGKDTEKEDLKEKAVRVSASYSAIKNSLQETIAANSPKKVANQEKK